MYTSKYQEDCKILDVHKSAITKLSIKNHFPILSTPLLDNIDVYFIGFISIHQSVQGNFVLTFLNAFIENETSNHFTQQYYQYILSDKK